MLLSQLAVHVPMYATVSMTFLVLNRTLFPEDELQVELVKKMTPRRKQLAKKVRKT